jgi:DNA-binding transcriptional regulator YdaS (Cro superfamily)
VYTLFVEGEALQRIIDRAGGQKPLADKLDVAQQTISWWLKNGVPAKWVREVIRIDRELGGRTKPNHLRPDIFGELRT